MKKACSALLIVLLLIGTLVACTETPEPEPESTQVPVVTASPEPEPIPEPENEQANTLAEQMAGMWRNSLGEILVIPSTIPQNEQWSVRETPYGAFEITVTDGSLAHISMWFFPIGVEMVRDNTDGSIVASDISRARLYLGPFSLTTCCPDEEINRDVYFTVEEGAELDTQETQPHPCTDDWKTWKTVTAEALSFLVCVPELWQSDEVDTSDPNSHLRLWCECGDGSIEMMISRSPIALSTLYYGFEQSDTDLEPFLFGDGSVGYMTEDPTAIHWFHIEEGFGIIQISLWHDGNRGIFANNEDLILGIVRSVRNNP